MLDYFKRFKDIKNHYFGLSISEIDLANLGFGGLCSYFKVMIFFLLTKCK